jgi:hypothetical protein
MVMVAMRAKRNHRPFSQHRDIFGNWSQAKACINNQITIPATHMPDIASPVSGNMCLQNA